MRPIEIIWVSRPIFWIVGLLAYLTGFFYSDSAFSMLFLLQAFMMTFPISFISFAINDIYDYDTDRANKRKKFLLEKRHHKDTLKLVHFFIILFLGLSILTLNAFNIFSCALLIFLVYFYSKPPLRFKENPPFDSISNGLMALFAFLIGHSYSFSFPIAPKIYLAAFCLSGMHAFTTIPDFSADKKAGQKTFSTVFGKRNATIFCIMTFLAALLFGNFSFEITVFLATSLVIFFIISIKPSEKLSLNASKLIYLLGIIIGLIYLSRNI